MNNNLFAEVKIIKFFCPAYDFNLFYY